MPSYHCWTAARHSSQQKRVVAPKHGGGCVQYFGIWQWYGNRYTQILAIHGCNYRWVIQNFHPFYFWYFFVAIFVRLKVVFNSKYIKHEMTIVRISAKGFFAKIVCRGVFYVQIEWKKVPEGFSSFFLKENVENIIMH